MAARDWYDWHDGYQRAGSSLVRRLAVVRQCVSEALDSCPPGPLRALSLCAGQGVDLLPVLATHPRGSDVSAVLVELDPRNAAAARRLAASAGLAGIEVRVADAGQVDGYADAAPAHLLLVCGVFGNVTDADIANTVAHCASLCAPGGTVVWTRHREPPDLVPTVCDWFAGNGFEPVWLSDAAEGFGVGVHRYAGPVRAVARGARLFTFVR